MFDKISAREAEMAQDIISLSKAGTMQLRRLAKVIHIKNYSKLKRDELALAIIVKKDEMWKQQQMELFQKEKP